VDEYRIKVTVRNNLLFTAIEKAGCKSSAQFCRANSLSEQSVSAMVAMRMPPINRNGEFCELATQLMEILGAAPTDLWSQEQLTLRLKKNGGEKVVSEDAIPWLLEQNNTIMTLPSPEDEHIKAETSSVINNILNSLPPREEKVLRLRFEQDLTLDEVADSFDVSKERIRQIEKKALLRLKNIAGRGKQLREIYEEQK
jgi:RNA polymerase sigma factor (sigma-70 family)